MGEAINYGSLVSFMRLLNDGMCTMAFSRILNAGFDSRRFGDDRKKCGDASPDNPSIGNNAQKHTTYRYETKCHLKINGITHFVLVLYSTSSGPKYTDQ